MIAVMTNADKSIIMVATWINKDGLMGVVASQGKELWISYLAEREANRQC